jgi:hypothetical protein
MYNAKKTGKAKWSVYAPRPFIFGQARGEGTLPVLVAELRTALGDDADEPRFVRTVRGYGYAFAGAAAVEGAEGAVAAAPPLRILWERRVIPLVEGDNVVGRDESAGVRIDVPGVSRRHARIRVRGEQATLEDLGSKNGTFLGGTQKRVTTAVDLADGDLVHVGRILLVFRSSAEDGSTFTEGSR